MQETEDLIQQDKMVLDFNWTGQYTKPGPRLYPHQWSWDSALIAIGYSRYDQERATSELTHLFDAQWKRSEEHTSELQSRQYLVCRLLLEKKKTKIFAFAFSSFVLSTSCCSAIQSEPTL